MYRRRRAVVFGGLATLLALVIYLLTSTGGGKPPVAAHQPPPHHTLHSAQASRSLEVGVRDLSVTDPSRTTYNYATGKSSAGRTLGIEVRYPTRFGAAAAETKGAKPAFSKGAHLVVFATGFRLQPGDYDALLDAWVKAGDVVAAIDFPDTTYPATEAAYTANLPHGSPEADVYNEPADVAFALHQLFGLEASTTSWLHGAFDPKVIALAGHSDGASAVAALAYDSNYAVSGLPVGAVLALSGGEFAISGQHYSAATAADAPLLVVQSAADTCAAPWQAVQLYDAIASPKYFLELHSATHLGAYNGSDPAAATVQKVTTAFLAAAFAGQVSGNAALLAAGAVSGVSSITGATLAAPITTPAGSGQCPHD
ncbi:MAG TPA: hypothetical protein VNF07_04720 [Acidimicrobiales bacterium]|nr:hypothetical protein [Acidimicrobiales bacterium]